MIKLDIKKCLDLVSTKNKTNFDELNELCKNFSKELIKFFKISKKDFPSISIELDKDVFLEKMKIKVNYVYKIYQNPKHQVKYWLEKGDFDWKNLQFIEGVNFLLQKDYKFNDEVKHSHLYLFSGKNIRNNLKSVDNYKLQILQEMIKEEIFKKMVPEKDRKNFILWRADVKKGFYIEQGIKKQNISQKILFHYNSDVFNKIASFVSHDSSNKTLQRIKDFKA